MRKLRAGKLGLVVLALSVHGAAAQDLLQAPQEAPTDRRAIPSLNYATPQPGGGYILREPGQMPTSVIPLRGGAYLMQTPGETPSYAIPQSGGGYAIEAPGAAPTFVGRLPF